MSTVLNPSVFITNNEKLVKKFFLDGTYINVEDLPNVPDALVIHGKTNKYLQSLDYSINFGGENNPSLTLEFIDSDGEFENNFFMHIISNAKTHLKNVFRDDQRKAIQNSFSKRRSDSVGGIIERQNSPQGISESQLTEIYKEANNWNRIFVAFGTDNLLANWSDVYAFYLNKTFIDVSNGLRKYVFSFFGSNESIFRPKLQYNFTSPNPSREFLFTDSIDKIVVDIASNPDQDTVENVLYRCTKKYLSVVTRTPETHIIGIIPSLRSTKDDVGVGVVAGGVGGAFGTGKSTAGTPINKEDTLFSTYLTRLGITESDAFTEVSLLSDNQIIPAGMRPNPGAPDADNERNKSLSSITGYFMVSDKKGTPTEFNPNFPDFYGPINKIDVGLKNILKTTDEFIIFQENNTKLISFWQSKGLIGKDTGEIGRCIVFGLKGMINEYLYRNVISIDSVEEESGKSFESYLESISDNFTPKLPIYSDEDKIYSKDQTVDNNVAKILLDPGYGREIISLISKKKSSSNFFEKINIDELAIDNDQLAMNFSKLFKTKGGLLELFEIPVFLNNLTNSNVLNLQYKNSDLYLQGVKTAVENDFSKTFISELTKNYKKVNINGMNLGSLFDEYAKVLKDSGIDKELTKKVLVQQFYLADSGDEQLSLSKEDIEFDAGVVTKTRGDSTSEYWKNFGQGVSRRRNIFSQLKDVKPKPLEKKNIPIQERVAASWFVGPEALFNPIESPQEVEARIRKATGDYIKPEEVQRVLDSLGSSSIAGRFDLLILNYGSTINIDHLLLAIAASNLKQDRRRNERTSAPIIDGAKIDELGIAKDKQTYYYALANSMFNLFDIKTKYDQEVAEGLVCRPKEFGLSQENIAAELWKHLNKLQTQLNIKTLPFFHLSTMATALYKPCFLFSKQVTPVNINSYDNTTKLDFYSGIYRITALKHVINTKECYSQFMLVKDIGNGYLY